TAPSRAFTSRASASSSRASSISIVRTSRPWSSNASRYSPATPARSVSSRRASAVRSALVPAARAEDATARSSGRRTRQRRGRRTRAVDFESPFQSLRAPCQCHLLPLRAPGGRPTPSDLLHAALRPAAGLPALTAFCADAVQLHAVPAHHETEEARDALLE